MMNTIYPADKIKIPAVTYNGNADNKIDIPRTGVSNSARLYFFKILAEWIKKCIFVNPKTAIGFFLNPFKYIALIGFELPLYKDNPASPVRFT